MKFKKKKTLKVVRKTFNRNTAFSGVMFARYTPLFANSEGAGCQTTPVNLKTWCVAKT